LQETVTVSGASPVVDVQNTRRETVIGADAIQSLPATRAYGSLLNAIAGRDRRHQWPRATPTMTFFSAHGGRTNEGRMSINGMTVAAAFNGGGVSSLTYDYEQRRRSGDAGVGRPRRKRNRRADDEPRAEIGWEQVLRSGLSSTPPATVARRQHRRHAAQSGNRQGPRDQELVRRERVDRRSDQEDRLWFYGTYRSYSTTSGVSGIGANKFAGDASHWDYQRDDSVEPRLVQSRQDLGSARHRADHPEKTASPSPRKTSTRCEGSTLTTNGPGVPYARRRLDRARIDDAVAGIQTPAISISRTGHAGDMDVAGDQQAAPRGRLLAVRDTAMPAALARCTGRHPQLDFR